MHYRLINIKVEVLTEVYHLNIYMGLIARNVESPSKIFSYQPKGSFKGYAVLQIASKKTDVKPGEIYEFSIPSDEGLKRYIGKVKYVLKNTAILMILGDAKTQRKFNRLVLSNIYLPVGVLVDKKDKPFSGILLDFSLGGFKAKFSQTDFKELKRIYTKSKEPPYTRAIFRFPTDKEVYEVDVIPIRFNDSENSIAFSYTFNEKNKNILKIYEKIMELLKEEEKKKE